jgi:hypothetical protein
LIISLFGVIILPLIDTLNIQYKFDDLYEDEVYNNKKTSQFDYQIFFFLLIVSLFSFFFYIYGSSFPFGIGGVLWSNKSFSSLIELKNSSYFIVCIFSILFGYISDFDFNNINNNYTNFKFFAFMLTSSKINFSYLFFGQKIFDF